MAVVKGEMTTGDTEQQKWATKKPIQDIVKVIPPVTAEQTSAWNAPGDGWAQATPPADSASRGKGGRGGGG